MTRWAVTLWVLAMAGCESAPTGPGGCVEITPTSTFRLQAGANSGWFTETYSAGYAPELAEGWSSLSMKLRADGIGTFDLAEEGDDTDSCERCVYVTYAGSGDHFQLDLAVSGTIEIEALDVDTGQARGVLRDVTFRHLSEVALHSFRGLHPDGHCTYLREARFDTFATPGAACERQGDCPNGKLQVCDPATRTCQLAQCTTESPSCPGEATCQIQQPLFGIGACHASCVPFTSGACAGGEECIPIDYVGERGICRAASTNAPGSYQSCTPGQATTGCGPGHVCTTDAVYWHASLCYPQCDYFGAQPGCDGRCRLVMHTQAEIDTAWLCGVGDCHFGGYCEREWDNAGVRYGMECEPETEGWACEGSDTRLGVCLDRGDGLRCHAHCRTAHDDCPTGQRCEPFVLAAGTDDARTIPGVGVCVQ